MTTTADLIDICSLYFTQAAIWLDIHSPAKMDRKEATWEAIRENAFRAFLFSLSANLILEGVY